MGDTSFHICKALCEPVRLTGILLPLKTPLQQAGFFDVEIVDQFSMQCNRARVLVYRFDTPCGTGLTPGVPKDAIVLNIKDDRKLNVSRLARDSKLRMALFQCKQPVISLAAGRPGAALSDRVAIHYRDRRRANGKLYRLDAFEQANGASLRRPAI